MNRGNTLLNTISKLNTFVLMYKSNEFLRIYIEKIVNNKSKNLKFINDFDSVSLDLLYTSLQIMNESEKISETDFNKLDKKELSYYMDKVKGINYFKKQVPQIKNEEQLINYLKKALANGEYICNNNNTVKFDNGLIVDSDWIVDFSSFIITSLNNNVNLSANGTTYLFNTVSIPKIEQNSKQFIKNIKLYEYCVTRKDDKKLTFQDIKYLINTLSVIKDYNFKQLQDINSKLAKEKYSLSVNKKNATFTKDDKAKIEKLLNEENYEEVLVEFIKDTLKCHNSTSNLNKGRLIDTYEILRSLSHAYKCNYTLDECRKLFSLKDYKQEIFNALSIADFYINYIYDESNLQKYFNYSLLKLNELKPTIIDYETPEYKNIIRNLSVMNKKVVFINRRINKYLEMSRLRPKHDMKFIEENSESFARDCRDLEIVVEEIRKLREELDDAKNENRHESNINKTKIYYIKDALMKGRYNFRKDKSLMVFDCFSPKDYHHTFHLELTLNEFNDLLLSDHNRNTRINFYQM